MSEKMKKKTHCKKRHTRSKSKKGGSCCKSTQYKKRETRKNTKNQSFEELRNNIEEYFNLHILDNMGTQERNDFLHWYLNNMADDKIIIKKLIKNYEKKYYRNCFDFG